MASARTTNIVAKSDKELHRLQSQSINSQRTDNGGAKIGT